MGCSLRGVEVCIPLAGSVGLPDHLGAFMLSSAWALIAHTWEGCSIGQDLQLWHAVDLSSRVVHVAKTRAFGPVLQSPWTLLT